MIQGISPMAAAQDNQDRARPRSLRIAAELTIKNLRTGNSPGGGGTRPNGKRAYHLCNPTPPKPRWRISGSATLHQRCREGAHQGSHRPAVQYVGFHGSFEAEF